MTAAGFGSERNLEVGRTRERKKRILFFCKIVEVREKKEVRVDDSLSSSFRLERMAFSRLPLPARSLTKPILLASTRTASLLAAARAAAPASKLRPPHESRRSTTSTLLPRRLSRSPSSSADALASFSLATTTATTMPFTFGTLSGAPAVLAAGALFDVAVQLAGWGVSVSLKTDKIYDFTASCTYVALALLSFFLGSSPASSSASPRQVAATTLLALWAARLGAFLLFRVLKLGGDSRFEEALKKPALFLVYWLMQALWIFATASGTLWLNGTPGGGGSGLKATDIIGPLLFFVGFVIESVADAQKLRFRLAVPSNKGKFIDEGLWSLSRYPNYFGEIVLQCGLWLLCVPSFGKSAAWLTVLGPVFVAFLLLFVSGVPLQEAQAKARWGEGDSGYQAYRKRTRLLVPVPKLFGGRV